MTKYFFVLFGLMICAQAVSADPLLDGDVKAGQQKSAVCAACHGPQGNMVSAQFPKLAGQGAPYIYEQLMLFKSGERNNAIMKGQAAGLDEPAMRNLAVYFASQQTKPGVSDVSIAPAGAALYHGGKADKTIPACSGCHGPSGMGNAAAKFPRLSGQNPQYIVTQLTAYREGKRSGYRNATIMNGVAQNLTDADIKALASYVSGLAPTGDGQRQEEYGALMQNASGPGAAKSDGDTAVAGQAGSDKNAGGDTGDQADKGDQAPASGDKKDAADAEQADGAEAAAKQNTGSAAGSDSAGNSDSGAAKNKGGDASNNDAEPAAGDPSTSQ